MDGVVVDAVDVIEVVVTEDVLVDTVGVDSVGSVGKVGSTEGSVDWSGAVVVSSGTSGSSGSGVCDDSVIISVGSVGSCMKSSS